MRITRVYSDSDLRSAHVGLAKLAGIEWDTIPQGRFYVFLNKRKTMAKVLTASNTMLHVKSHHGLELSALQYLPRIFARTGRLDYPRALGIALTKKLRGSRGVGQALH